MAGLLDLSAGDVVPQDTTKASPATASDMNLSSGDIPAPGGMASGRISRDQTPQQQYPNVDPSIMNNLRGVESGGHHYDRGSGDVLTSDKGARGQYQIMPATAKSYPGLNLDDPDDNERMAYAHMNDLLQHFHGNWELAIAAYHAGAGAVDKAGGIPNTSDGHMTTKDYVKSILGKQGQPAAQEQFDLSAGDISAPAQSLSQPDALAQAKDVYKDDPLKQRFIQNVANSPRFQALTQSEQLRVLQGNLGKLSPEQIQGILQPVPSETTKGAVDNSVPTRISKEMYDGLLKPTWDFFVTLPINEAKYIATERDPGGVKQKALDTAREQHRQQVMAQAGKEFHDGKYWEAIKSNLSLLSLKTADQPGQDPNDPLQRDFLNPMAEAHAHVKDETQKAWAKVAADPNWNAPPGEKGKINDAIQALAVTATNFPAVGPLVYEGLEKAHDNAAKGKYVEAGTDLFNLAASLKTPEVVGKGLESAMLLAKDLPTRLGATIVHPSDPVNQFMAQGGVRSSVVDTMNSEGGNVATKIGRSTMRTVYGAGERNPVTSGIADREKIGQHSEAVDYLDRIIRDPEGVKVEDLPAASGGAPDLPRMERPSITTLEGRQKLGMSNDMYRQVTGEEARPAWIEAMQSMVKQGGDALKQNAIPAIAEAAVAWFTNKNMSVGTALTKLAAAETRAGVTGVVSGGLDYLNKTGKLPPVLQGKMGDVVSKMAGGAVGDVVGGQSPLTTPKSILADEMKDTFDRANQAHWESQAADAAEAKARTEAKTNPSDAADEAHMQAMDRKTRSAAAAKKTMDEWNAASDRNPETDARLKQIEDAAAERDKNPPTADAVDPQTIATDQTREALKKAVIEYGQAREELQANPTSQAARERLAQAELDGQRLMNQAQDTGGQEQSPKQEDLPRLPKPPTPQEAYEKALQNVMEARRAVEASDEDMKNLSLQTPAREEVRMRDTQKETRLALDQASRRWEAARRNYTPPDQGVKDFRRPTALGDIVNTVQSTAAGRAATRILSFVKDTLTPGKSMTRTIAEGLRDVLHDKNLGQISPQEAAGHIDAAVEEIIDEVKKQGGSGLVRYGQSAIDWIRNSGRDIKEMIAPTSFNDPVSTWSNSKKALWQKKMGELPQEHPGGTLNALLPQDTNPADFDTWIRTGTNKVGNTLGGAAIGAAIGAPGGVPGMAIGAVRGGLGGLAVNALERAGQDSYELNSRGNIVHKTFIDKAVDKTIDVGKKAVGATAEKVQEWADTLNDRTPADAPKDPDWRFWEDPDAAKDVAAQVGKQNMPATGDKLLDMVRRASVNDTYKTIDGKLFKQSWDRIDPANKRALFSPELIKNMDTFSQGINKFNLRNYSALEIDAGRWTDQLAEKSKYFQTLGDFMDFLKKHDLLHEGPMRNPLGKTAGAIAYGYYALQGLGKFLYSMNPITPASHAAAFQGSRYFMRVLATKGGANNLMQALSATNMVKNAPLVGSFTTRNLARMRVGAILAIAAAQDEQQHDVLDDIELGKLIPQAVAKTDKVPPAQ